MSEEYQTMHSEPADLENNASNKSRRITVDSTDTLGVLDRSGKGHVTTDDIRVGIRQMKATKKLACFLVLLSIFLLVGMCVSTYFAVKLSTETHVQNARLVDGDGKPISSLQRAETIHGVGAGSSRRLLDLKTNSEDSSAPLSMSRLSFTEVCSIYSDGMDSFHVDLPDGSVRNVRMQGMDASGAWGLCSSYEADFKWHARCPLEGGDCDITWEMERRRLKSEERVPGMVDSSNSNAMDRALNDKWKI